MYLSYYLVWPGWARTIGKWVRCLTRGHQYEELGERKPAGLMALVVGGGYQVERCNRCGHYRERYKSPAWLSSSNKIVWNRVEMPSVAVKDE